MLHSVNYSTPQDKTARKQYVNYLHAHEFFAKRSHQDTANVKQALKVVHGFVRVASSADVHAVVSGQLAQILCEHNGMDPFEGWTMMNCQ